MKKYIVSTLIALVICACLCSCGNSVSSSESKSSTTDSSAEPIEYTYTNAKNQTVYFKSEKPNIVLYTKTVGELISEWTENVALAEKTYNQDNAFIIVEGYIQNINKGTEDGTYYLLLSEEKEPGAFSNEEIRIYFYDENALEGLFSIKKGDYATLLCAAQDTTYFLEYPELEAILVLTPQPIYNADIGISSMLGLTVSDVVSCYGNEYVVDNDEENMFFAYDDCPYKFYYSTVFYDGDRTPNMDDKIWGVETSSDDIIIVCAGTDKVKIGSSLESSENFFETKFTLQDNSLYVTNGGMANVTYNAFNYNLIFDKSVETLVSASCWTEFEAPEHPDVLQEKIDALTFSQGDVELAKKGFMLSMLQDDIEGYRQGKDSMIGNNSYEYFNFEISQDLDWQAFWDDLVNDLDNYLSKKQCKYEKYWDLEESMFYLYASGAVDDMIDVDAVNKAYTRLGNF